jgi:hypothetical protein
MPWGLKRYQQTDQLHLIIGKSKVCLGAVGNLQVKRRLSIS